MRRRRIVLGIVVFGALATAGLGWRASWISHRLLRSWTAATIRDKSGDVYRLAVGQVRLNFLLRRITVDSLVVTTNTAVNTLRPRPLTTLALTFRRCTISGVRLAALVKSGGLIAESFDCEEAKVDVLVPRGAPITDVPRPVAAQRFVAFQQSVRLPSYAPRVRIAHVAFPRSMLDVRVEHDLGADSRVHLEQLRWRMEDFVIDPADSAAGARPLFSRVVELGATDFVARRDSISTMKVDSLVASLTDSTLDVHGITYAPTMSNAAFARTRPYRRTVMRSRVGRVSVRGIDVGALLLGRGLHAGRVEVDSLRVVLLSDRTLPASANPRRRRTPQEWIADLGATVSVDSLFLRHGRITYHLQRAERDLPGVITFARINAVGANLRHAVADRTEPMTLRVSGYLQNSGRIDARFVIPLDAPRFAMTFRGRLGTMPAADLNVFVEETYSLRITRGQVDSIAFRATVVNGAARGTITPHYTGLAFAATRVNRTGILGRGGFLGSAARSVASMAGNWKLYTNNPDDGRTRPRVGAIRHTFTSNESLPAFLWTGLRGGLVEVVTR